MATILGLEINEIQKQCEINEYFLKELVEGRYSYMHNYLQGELRFGVARRWNSWYPSYFNIKGGCYVLIPGDWDPDKEEKNKETRVGVIVIDPGFSFIDILRETYQIEPQDISTVIVTHFHPDHMVGLLEYATIMKTSKQHCDIYLNETTFATFKSLQSNYITIHELRNGQIQEIMCYTTNHNDYLKVTVKAIDVHHSEMGNQHRSLGLILETTRSKSKTSKTEIISNYRIGILGDTDSNEEYIQDYISNFQNVDIFILHLGTFSDKNTSTGGKHLYIDGVKSILEKMTDKLNTDGKIMVLSEFGLELADEFTLYRNLQPFIESHFWRLPIIFAHLYTEDKNKRKNEKEYSHLFARATLSIIERFYKVSDNMISLSQQELTKKEKEELLLALAFQVLVLHSSNEFKEKIKELYDRINQYTKKVKEEEIRDELQLKEYIKFLSKNCPNFSLLKEAYKDMVDKADFTETPLPKGHLIESCNVLIEKIGRNLENPGSALFYIDKIDYISKYAKSRGIKENNYNWIYHRSGIGISNLGLLWTTCLIGIFLLLKELEKYEPNSDKRQQDYPLIKIRDFFQQFLESSANLIIGDIGLTFGIDPLIPPERKERKLGIKLKSSNGDGKWISPENIICKYDTENERIGYFER